MKPMQYLLVGFPYSGKTTLAKELKSRLGFEHVNIDQLKFDRGYSNVGDDDVPDKMWDAIFQEADRLLVQYLQAGKSVVNEYAWISKEWRDRARKVAKDAGFQTKIIYLKLPLETIRKRWEENSQIKERFHWEREEFERLLADFEELTIDENFIIYDQIEPIEEWTKNNL